MKKPVKKNLAEIREETFDPAPFQEAPKPKSEKTKNPKKIRKESSGTESAKPGKRSITLKDFQSEEMLSSLKKPEELNEEEPEISETPEKTEPEKKSPAPESAEETPKSRKYLKKDLSSIWEEELKLHDAKKAQKKSSLTKEQLELF